MSAIKLLRAVERLLKLFFSSERRPASLSKGNIINVKEMVLENRLVSVIDTTGDFYI